MTNFSLEQFNGSDFFLFLIILIVAITTLIIVRRLLKVSFPYFFTGLIGLIIGLILGALVSSPLSRLPGNFGRWLPLIVNVFITVSILDLFLAQSRSIAKFFSRMPGAIMTDADEDSCDIIMDTSVLIDGRIDEIAKTGFVMGRILIPQFVLNELQNIADSSDSLKRAKGRKGMDILDDLRRTSGVKVEIIDDIAISREPVDNRLVKVAKNRGAKILTVDYNLNKIAKIQGIEVLNINELAESIKPILVPGEDVVVKVIQEGKEASQGVGYLSDGTMIVVESGAKLIGQEVKCEVIRIFQTVAGKMIFVQPKQKIGRSRKNL